MKSSLLLLLYVSIIILTAPSAEYILEVKPGQLNVVVFTDQSDLERFSFVVKRISPQLETLTKEEREILDANETVFLNIYLKTADAPFFTAKTGLRNECGEKSETILRPITFNEPFRFDNAPTNANSFVIETISGRAAAGAFIFAAKDKAGNTIAERIIKILPQYSEIIATMLQPKPPTGEIEKTLNYLQSANKELKKRAEDSAKTLKKARERLRD